MSARNNFLKMYRREGYNHVPVMLHMCPSLHKIYEEKSLGVSLEEYFDYPEGFATQGVDLKWKESFHDWSSYYPNGLKEGVIFDSFGVAHEPGSEAAAHMTRMCHPMALLDSLEQLQSYPFPGLDPESLASLPGEIEKIHLSGKASVGSVGSAVWEQAWALRDMTVLFEDICNEDEKAVFLLDYITEMSCQRARAFARAKVDLLILGDDVGMQNSLMMSPIMYKTWFKPRLAKVIAAAKEEHPDILIHYHSCGYVEPLIQDFIDAGIDILNPVQPECMNFAELHQEFGDRISFNGTLGTQTTMPFGTPEDVKQVVYRNLEIAGPQGGLLCCPTHLLEPDVPWENIEAYVEACKTYSNSSALT